MVRVRHWCHRHRIWLVALLPAIVLAIVLSSWHSRSRVGQLESQIIGHTQALARQFASLAGPDVFTDDRLRLQSTVEAVERHYPAIVAAAVTDAQGEIIAQASSSQADTTSAAPDGPLRHIEQPIDGLVSAAGTHTEHAPGHFLLTIDLSVVRARQPSALLETLGVAGTTLLLALAIIIPTSALVVGSTPSLPPPLPRLRAATRALWRRLRQPITGLEATVARLHADNSRLDTARREAEAASERKSRYLADISHEIRTPMNAILGYTDLLAQDDQRGRHADYVATIRESVDGLLPLLNGVLDLSKAQAGHIRLNHEEIDLNRLLAEMFRLFAPQSFAKGVELIVEPLPHADAAVHADPMRLKQVLVNLVSNAIRFTDRGHIRLSATAVAGEGQRSTIRFTVEDCGCGIPEEVKPRLFEAFEQGDHTGNGPSLEAGTGLGLSIASELVGLMGGRIEFDSVANRGATFWFELDFDQTAPEMAGDTAAAPHPRIALVDPDAVTRGPYTTLLKRAGIGVEPLTEDQLGPADRSAWRRYDAIVVHVPASAGVTRPIPEPPAHLERTGLPLVALVHDQGPTLRRALWKAGYRRILGKSADPAILRDAFDQALAREPRPPAVDTPSTSQRRLLIVDDHAVNLRLMSEHATLTGFEAITASSSEDALRRAETESFDAIVMDLHLPERDGAETARLLRTGGGPNARTPIIAVTGDALAEQANRAIRAGIDDILIKPISRTALINRLQAWNVPDPRSVPSSTGGTAPLDASEANRRARGRPDVARELFTILCRTLPPSRDTLAQARTERDWKTIREESHRLQGAVAYCGVPRLEAALAELQTATRDSDPAVLERAVIRVEQSIAEVLEFAEQSHSAAQGEFSGDRPGGRNDPRASV